LSTTEIVFNQYVLRWSSRQNLKTEQSLNDDDDGDDDDDDDDDDKNNNNNNNKDNKTPPSWSGAVMNPQELTNNYVRYNVLIRTSEHRLFPVPSSIVLLQALSRARRNEVTVNRTWNRFHGEENNSIVSPKRLLFMSANVRIRNET
jgi:hypothetical protein